MSFFDDLAERKKPLLIGIVNATGDSFSEGEYSSPQSAVRRALQLLDDGADILDIGGESTRPGAAEIPPQLEISRLSSVVAGILEQRPETVISIDTRHSATAEEMLRLGAKIINDVSMLRFDPQMVQVLHRFPECGLILCHSRGIPQDMQSGAFFDYGTDVVQMICDELLEAASRSGIDAGRIWFDPGFGFAKDAGAQIRMLREAERFSSLTGGKVVFGISRKSIIGSITGEKDPAGRTGGTLAAELHLASCGAAAIRTHQVKLLRDALEVWRTAADQGGN